MDTVIKPTAWYERMASSAKLRVVVVKGYKPRNVRWCTCRHCGCRDYHERVPRKKGDWYSCTWCWNYFINTDK